MQTPIEQQLKYNDCGICAVKTIYNLHNISISRNYIEENIHLDESGSSLAEIKEFFDKHQFRTEFHLLDLNSLRFDEFTLNEYTPCILPIKNNQGLHYVVIKGINSKRIEILDPSKGQINKWTFSELMKNAHTAIANYDWVSNKEVLQHFIKEELQEYKINEKRLKVADKTDVINKLTYFSYIKENFGFAHKNAEKAFLKDLLFNQELPSLPRQFKTLKLNKTKLQIKAPIVLTVKKDEKINQAAPTSLPAEKPIHPYRRLFNELKQYRGLWGIYITSAVVAATITQLTVFSNQILIDHVLPDFNSNLLIVFAIGLGVFKIFNLILSLYKSFISIHLSNILDHYFLSSFIEKLNTFSIRYIHSYSKGDLTERIKDSLALKSFFMSFFTRMLIDGFVTIYSLIVLFIINWKVTFVVLCFLAFFVVWFKVITPYIRENEKLRFLEKSKLFSSLFENIDGLQAIKSFRMEHFFMQRISPKIISILNIQKRMKYVGLVNSAVTSIATTIASLLILVLLTQTAINSQSISMGQIITFLALSYQIFSSVESILDENLSLQENEIILSRYFDFGNGQSNTENVPLHNKIKTFDIEKIEFRDISFHYIPQKPVFSNLNIVIHKGDKIKLEGSNGAGKSTFCKVLSLLYTPDSGNILINNEKQLFYNPSALRKKILLVSNEDILFNDTIGFNVTFNHNFNASDVLSLAKDIGLYDFISEKDEGLDFIINEQGRNLSTGQRKKVLLMRALFSDAELIVLDETLSGIDKESRERIEGFINSQTERTFIIISHEPLSYLKFSKTLIMQNGTIEQLQYESV